MRPERYRYIKEVLRAPESDLPMRAEELLSEVERLNRLVFAENYHRCVHLEDGDICKDFPVVALSIKVYEWEEGGPWTELRPACAKHAAQFTGDQLVWRFDDPS